MGAVANDCKQLMLCKNVVLIMLLIMNYVITYFLSFSFLVTEPSHQSPLLIERKAQRIGALMCLDPMLSI